MGRRARLPAASAAPLGRSTQCVETRRAMAADEPKSLADLQERRSRGERLNDPAVAPLTKFVDRIRRERDCGPAVPYCDPSDGGIEAECLFLLEAPGSRAVESGFVSRNNPDETAKNWHLLNAAAWIDRRRTLTWNIVPWYIDRGGRIRPAVSRDLEEGWPYLVRLLELLPRLRVVVLVGRNAQRVRTRLATRRGDLLLIDCPHPSPLFVNRRPGNRELLLEALRSVAEALHNGGPSRQGAA